MRAGDFRICRGYSGSVTSDLVGVFEKSNWVHVQSAIDEHHYLDPVWPYILSVTGELTSDPDHWLIQPDLTDFERAMIGNFLAQNAGQHYGFWAFLWAGLTVAVPFLRRIHNPIRKAGRVCSTTLAWAYFYTGSVTYMKLFNHSFDVTPGAVNYIPHLPNPEAVTPAMLATAWRLPA